MNERQARVVTLLEAFETVRPPDPAWSDEDRAWADRVAVEAAGVGLPPDEFVAQRAGHALQRLGTREPRLVRWLARPLGVGRWAVVIVVVAFGFGLVLDRLDPGQRINLLALPLLGVVAWNLAVYALALALAVAAPLRARAARRAPLAERLRRLLDMDAPPVPRAAGGRPALQFAALWPARHGRISALRLQAVLHMGAAALALGLVAGLYLRGLVHDYRVNWESTFLSPAAAHAVVTTLLAPASGLSGLALPDVAGFAALRAAQGDRATGAPAADWIHLLALTLALLVVMPRLLLAAIAAGVARWRAHRFVLALDAPYFRRIVRLSRSAVASVRVLPYARTPSARGALALRELAATAFGPRVGFEVAPTVAFDAEDEVALAPATTHAIALFDLGATPEAESQGRFVARLASALTRGPGDALTRGAADTLPPGSARTLARGSPGTPAHAPEAVLAIVVDEGPFRARFAGLPERLAQRRTAWRDWGAGIGLEPFFVDLEADIPEGAAAALEAAFTDPRAALMR